MHGLITGSGKRGSDDGKAGAGAGGGAGGLAGGGVPMEQVLHSVGLANELLPPVGRAERLVTLVEAVGGGTEAVHDVFGQGGGAGLLEAFAAGQGRAVREYGVMLLPVLVDISVTVVSDAIRHRTQSLARARTHAATHAPRTRGRAPRLGSADEAGDEVDVNQCPDTGRCPGSALAPSDRSG